MAEKVGNIWQSAIETWCHNLPQNTKPLHDYSIPEILNQYIHYNPLITHTTKGKSKIKLSFSTQGGKVQVHHKIVNSSTNKPLTHDFLHQVPIITKLSDLWDINRKSFKQEHELYEQYSSYIQDNSFWRRIINFLSNKIPKEFIATLKGGDPPLLLPIIFKTPKEYHLIEEVNDTKITKAIKK